MVKLRVYLALALIGLACAIYQLHRNTVQLSIDSYVLHECADTLRALGPQSN